MGRLTPPFKTATGPCRHPAQLGVRKLDRPGTVWTIDNGIPGVNVCSQSWRWAERRMRPGQSADGKRCALLFEPMTPDQIDVCTGDLSVVPL
jgi:hypothetical protein